MTGMEIFSVVVGVSTIVSLGLSIFATTQVISVKNSLKVTRYDSRNTQTGNQSITGNGNNQSGGSIG